MKEFVSSCPAGQYDLVFASFAVHHLSLEGKAEFAAQVGGWLGGWVAKCSGRRGAGEQSRGRGGGIRGTGGMTGQAALGQQPCSNTDCPPDNPALAP